MSQTWREEVWHTGLGKHRIIRGSNFEEVQRKAAAQYRAWDEEWTRRCAREAAQSHKRRMQETANQRTKAAQHEIRLCQIILKQNLEKTFSFSWTAGFSESAPSEPSLVPEPPKPLAFSQPKEPRPEDRQYAPRLSIRWLLSKKYRASKRMESLQHFTADWQAWKKQVADSERSYEQASMSWTRESARIREMNQTAKRHYESALREWRGRQGEYPEAQKKLFVMGDASVVRLMCSTLLAQDLILPSWCPRECDAAFLHDTRTLIVDVLLPVPSDVPSLKEVKYVQTRDELQEIRLSSRERKKLYDDGVHQIVLSAIHALYQADADGLVSSTVLNGWVLSTDPRTGQSVRPCIVSVQASKEVFLELDLAKVDAKACARGLKGVSAASVYNMVPIAPLMQISREDSRFVTPRHVASKLQEGENLAVMNWEDFEHLIREVFHAEFARKGGEVKITQASRDRGVDAIAFDPDPISGGKIVIQAKRYTDTVPVAAVRDLYGTVISEGATKGILVTTSDYGHDSYEFAKNKPLTLLSGNHLLHLLEMHGRKVRIDLAEARRLQADSGQ